MNFYPFNIGDYSAATRHLTWDEDLAFRRLIDAYYNREEPLPLDRNQVYRLVLARTNEQREAVDIVVQEFFVETESGWANYRCDEEIIKANDKKNKASASAEERWRIAREKNDALPSNSERNAMAMRTHKNDMQTHSEGNDFSCEGNAPNPNPNPNPNVNLKRHLSDKSDVVEAFDKFWLAYPKKVAKPNALRAWRSAKPNLEIVLATIAKMSATDDWMKESGKYIPMPATFLNQRRWEDETSPTGGVLAMPKKYRLHHLGFVEEFSTVGGVPGWSATEYKSLEDYESARCAA